MAGIIAALSLSKAFDLYEEFYSISNLYLKKRSKRIMSTIARISTMLHFFLFVLLPKTDEVRIRIWSKGDHVLRQTLGLAVLSQHPE